MDKKDNSIEMSFWRKWKIVIISVSATLFVVTLIVVALGIGFLKYYSDGGDIKRTALGAPLRSVLWEDPKLLDGYINQVRKNRDATISPDGKMIILSHEKNDGNYCLYVSYLKKDDTWTKQLPIDEINSDYNDMGPEFSSDGKFLFFYSNRPGGFGGYDIWYSFRDDDKRWSRPVNLGKFINTTSNEIDPAISPDKERLFFASDRPVSNEDLGIEKPDYDLYVAAADKKTLKAAEEIIPRPPVYKLPVNLHEINSPANERKAVITPRENTIYFSSDRGGGYGGYDLYRSYFVEGKFLKPINFGTPINSEFDETSPTMTLEGFGIYFSSNRKSRNFSDFYIYSSTSREVVKKFDYAALMRLIAIISIIIISVIIIYILLKIMLADTRMKLLTKCFLAAIILHLIFLILSAFWFLSKEMGEALKQAPKEMTINVNNLARESIAMAIRESTASLPKVKTTAVAEKLPVPSQKPVSSKSTPTKATSVPKSAVSPVAMKTVQDISGEPPQGETLPTLAPFHPGAKITMETPPGNNPGAAASTSGDESDGIPRPVFKTTKRLKEIPRIKLDSVPLETEITQIEDPTVTVAEKNNSGPPSIEKALTQNNRITDTPEGKDSADQIMLAASAPTVNTMSDSMGTLIFSPRIVMEEAQQREMKKSPKLGMLLKDPKIARALTLSMQDDLAAKKELKDMVEAYIRKNKIKFNSFEVVKFLISERKLNPVDSLVYNNLPKLNIPVDAELEVPEKYNK
jgi:Tol biopolymer transport system component